MRLRPDDNPGLLRVRGGLAEQFDEFGFDLVPAARRTRGCCADGESFAGTLQLRREVEIRREGLDIPDTFGSITLEEWRVTGESAEVDMVIVVEFANAFALRGIHCRGI